MTKELVEAENHYFVLGNLLLQRVAQKKPEQLDTTKNFLIKLDRFSVAEKTLHVGKLLKAIESKYEEAALQQLELTMKQEKISVATISLMKQYMRALNEY